MFRAFFTERDAFIRQDAEDRAMFREHMAQCLVDKEAIRTEVREGLRAQTHERQGMHNENTASFREIKASVQRLQVVYYFVSAIIAVLGFLSTEWGSNILIKLGLLQQ